ncbi:MAG: AI-2E family transporter [Clostridia bacterium]|nr:AI-2E family transporter [Clostridia bacterium]
MNIIEKRRATLINLGYFSFLIVTYYLFLKYAFWVVAPFIFAFLLAMGLQRPIRAITGKTKLKKSLVGGVLVFLILALVLAAVVLVGYRIGVEFKGFWNFVMGKINDLPNLIEQAQAWLLEKIRILPDSIEQSVRDAVTEFTGELLTVGSEEEAALESGKAFSFGGLDFGTISSSLGGLLSTAKRIPAIFTAVLVSIIACFFVTCDYDGFVGLIKNMLSAEHEEFVVRAKHILSDVLGKLVKSYVTIIFITFCELSIGLNILKLIGVYEGGYIMVIAICTAMLDILPVFGTGTVLVPWAIASFLTGKVGLGVGLAVMYALITVIRQVLEPRLVAMNVGLHPVLTLAGMYLGLNIFGVIGIFIVPITFVLIGALHQEGLIHLWTGGQKTPKPTAAAAEAPQPPEIPENAGEKTEKTEKND